MRVTETSTDQSALTNRLRARPDDIDARLQLFRYAVIDGNWDRARNQLDVAEKMDAALSHTCMVYRCNIGCEQERHAVFAGARAPLFLGEPLPWMGCLVQSLQEKDERQASALAAAALEQAEAVGGVIDGEPFAWLADGDSRLGPVLEAFIDGKYYWVPCERLSAIRIAEPGDLLDLAWCPCELTLRNGGECKAYVPVRYPGSESSAREEIRLARMTEWEPWSDTLQKGLGQRMLITDQAEHALLDCREIVFVAADGEAA